MDLALRLIIGFLLGIAIGVEREVNDKQPTPTSARIATLGIRSFGLVSILGGLTGICFNSYPILAGLITSGVFLLLVALYILDTLESKHASITTELALIFCFVANASIVLEIVPIQITLATTAVVVLLLSQKEQILEVVKGVKKVEINAFVSYGIIALVVLPFLPNQSFSLESVPVFRDVLLQTKAEWANKVMQLDFVNPFRLWFIVAVITGIDLFGYVLERVFGQKKGWIMASIVGGFVSSTATTISLAQESKSSKGAYHLAGASILANMVSFIQFSALIIAFNTALFFQLAPTIIAMIVVASGFSWFYFYRHKTTITEFTLSQKTEIFNLKTALKFMLLFLCIGIITQVALVFFGDTGFVLATGLGALTGLDAVTINAAHLAGSTVTYTFAAKALIFANAVNLTLKMVYAFLQGSRDFAKLFSIAALSIIIMSGITILFFN